MKRTFQLLIVVSGIGLVFSAMIPSPPTPTDYITASPWKLVKSIISPALDTNDTSITDLMFIKDTCLLDDYYVYSTDSIMLVMDDDIKCDTLHTDPYPYIWHFDSSDTYIYYESVFLPVFTEELCEILLLDSDSLVIEANHFYNESVYTIENTYIHY